jgi:hypothetical protein
VAERVGPVKSGFSATTDFAMRWRDLKFVAPRPASSLLIPWFPAL